MSDIKPCIECKYSSVGLLNQCKAPQRISEAKLVGIDAITGKESKFILYQCSGNRNYSDLCGNDGRWFVKKQRNKIIQKIRFWIASNIAI